MWVGQEVTTLTRTNKASVTDVTRVVRVEKCVRTFVQNFGWKSQGTKPNKDFDLLVLYIGG